MIYVTGDTHCPIDMGKLNRRNFDDTKLTKNDYLIICGDAGLLWKNRDNEDAWWQRWLESRNFTTLFVDGNHENHDALDEMEVHEWNGGKVHFLNKSVIHLMRGQVYTIDGKKIFTMGGASSPDRIYRKEGISWWKRELPSTEEFFEAEQNLIKHNWQVDYVITHCAPLCIQMQLLKFYDSNRLVGFLHDIDKMLEYKQWYFGHFHDDRRIDSKHTLLYKKIIEITEEGAI